jgi:hypothetical protein
MNHTTLGSIAILTAATLVIGTLTTAAPPAAFAEGHHHRHHHHNHHGEHMKNGMLLFKIFCSYFILFYLF